MGELQRETTLARCIGQEELMASPWIDVSVTLKTAMVNWPGDPAVRFSHATSIERGDPATVSLLEMGAHTGTHMDAPAHFVRGGIGIDEMPLDAAMGMARVIPIRDRESIKVEELRAHFLQPGERVLFKTYNSEHCWDTDELRRGLRLPIRSGGRASGRAKGGAGRDRLPIRRRFPSGWSGDPPGPAQRGRLGHRGAGPEAGPARARWS